MKLYFTCPLKAAYMAKEFGVTIYGLTGKTRHPLSSDWDRVINFRCGNMYVAKKSESIFLPLDGDFGMWSKLERPMTYRQRSKWKEFNNGGYFSDTAEIIMRDNKHFFMPEVEGE